MADSIQDMLMWTDAIRCLMNEYNQVGFDFEPFLPPKVSRPEFNPLKGQLSSLSSHFTEDVEALCRLKMRIILTQFRGETNIEIPESFPNLSSLEPVPTDWLIETA